MNDELHTPRMVRAHSWSEGLHTPRMVRARSWSEGEPCRSAVVCVALEATGRRT